MPLYSFTHSVEYQEKKVNERELYLRGLAGQYFEEEGLIGIGKTALFSSAVHYLQRKGLTHSYISETRSKELFEAFLVGQNQITLAEPYNPHAFPFQMDMIDRRSRHNIDAHKLLRTGCAYWADRGLLGDYTFLEKLAADGTITLDEREAYIQCVPAIDTVDPAVLVFLDGSPAKALERCRKRSRDGEDVYTLEYMVGLRNAYARSLANADYTILVLDWSEDRKISLHHSAQTIEDEFMDGKCLLSDAVIAEFLKLMYHTIAPPPGQESFPAVTSTLKHRILRNGAGRQEFLQAVERGPECGILF